MIHSAISKTATLNLGRIEKSSRLWISAPISYTEEARSTRSIFSLRLPGIFVNTGRKQNSLLRILTNMLNITPDDLLDLERGKVIPSRDLMVEFEYS